MVFELSVLNRIYHKQSMYVQFVYPKQGQGFKSSAAHMYPSIGRVTPGLRTHKDKLNKTYMD